MESIIPILEVAGLIKVVTWIKLALDKVNVKVEGVLAWVLVIVVALIWHTINLLQAGTAITIASMASGLMLAFQAIVGYGAAQLGLFGQPGKDLVNKPLI